MAEFSTQYCEISEIGFHGDFDVYKEWDNLQVGYHIPIICEGFGFNAIGKLEESPDKVMVHFWDYEKEEGRWVDFNQILLRASITGQ